MGAADTIGTVAVNITGDYSDLQDALEQAQAAAESGGDQVAAAFSSAGDEAHYAGQGVGEFNTQIHDTPGHAKEGSEALGEFVDHLKDLAVEFGLLIGAKEAITETFESFSRVESASVALTALTGSAATANEEIERLEQMATDENLSFPALLDANQKMTAFGFSAEDIPAALQAAADAAAALNSSIDQTAASIDRMAASGMAGARQLVALGLTTKDLADVMGVAEEDVKKTFAALDQETRLEILDAALQKFAGQSQVAAGTLKGEWQGVKNTFEGFFISLGTLLEPAAKEVLKWFDTIGKGAEMFVLATQVNLEKLEFYFDKFTGQVDAANAKAQEINANAAKFRALVEGIPAGGAGAGPKTEKPDIAGLQAKVAAELADKEAVDQLSQAEIDLNNRTQAQINFSDVLAARLSLLQSEHEKYAKAVAESGLTTDEFGRKSLADAITAMDAAQASTPPVINDFKQFAGAAKDAGAMLDGMIGKVTPPFDALHDSLRRIDADLASGNYADIQRIINRLAVDDLPTAVEQQERYVAALERANVSAEKLATAQQQLVQLQMQLAEAQDKSTTGYAIKLALLDVQTRNLGYDTRNFIGTLATQSINVLDKALGSVGNTIAKTAIETRDWGKTAHQLVTQVAEELLGTLFNALIKMGEQFVLEKILEKTSSSVTAISGVTNAAGVGYANAFASIAAIPIVGPAMAPGIAAATEAAILAGGLPLASAAQGAVLGTDTIVQAHAEEMILPSALSNGLQDLIAGNGRGAGNTGPIVNIGSVSGVTRETVRSVAEEIVNHARRAGAFR